MKIKKVPNPLKIGEYTVFVKDFSKSEEQLLKDKIAVNPEITKVFIVPSSDKEELNLNLNVETKICNNEELDQIKSKIKLPNWVKHQRNLENILEGDYLSIKPLTAEFITTLNCNFRCVQCSYSEPKKEEGVWLENKLGDKLPKFQTNLSSSSSMTEDVMRVTLDKLAEGGVRNILFTGGGEPLMNSVTLRGMERATQNGNITALYTNGRLMSRDISERILDLDPLFVRISVYGGNQEASHNYTQAFKDKLSFPKVLKNIKHFAEAKREIGSDTNLGLSYLVHPLTSGSMDDFAKSIIDLEIGDQIDYIRFTPAVDYFFGKQHDQKTMQEMFRNIEEKVTPRLEEVGVKVKPYYHRLNDLNVSKSYDVCRASGWFVEVGPSGELFLCCEKHFMPEYRIGDLTRDDLQTIWNSDLRKEVSDKVNDTNCGDCPTLCKPHELNKLFDLVEAYRSRGEIGVVDNWAKDLILYGRVNRFCPGKLDDFSS